MNRFSTVLGNVVDAIKAVPALAGIPVEPVVYPADVWAVIPEGIGIGVAIPHGKWDLADHDLNYYVDQPAMLRVQVAIKTDSPASNTEGLVGPGQLFDLVAGVLSMRGTSVGVAGETGDCYLTAEGFDIVVSKTRAEGGAGPLALVISFRIEPIAL